MNRIVDAWRNDRAVLGAWNMSGAPSITAAMVASGSDFVGLDCQHSTLHESDVAAIVSNLDPERCPIAVRVSKNDEALIGKVADAGASVVIIPMVETGAEAGAAVAACRYSPDGTRSFGPIHPALRTASLAEIEAHVSCLVMIESRRGLENLDEILSVSALGGVYVGPKDLAISLGLTDDHPESRAALDDAILSIARGCARWGVTFGLSCPNGTEAARWLRQNARFVAVGNDASLILAGLSESLRVARA